MVSLNPIIMKAIYYVGYKSLQKYLNIIVDQKGVYNNFFFFQIKLKYKNLYIYKQTKELFSQSTRVFFLKKKQRIILVHNSSCKLQTMLEVNSSDRIIIRTSNLEFVILFLEIGQFIPLDLLGIWGLWPVQEIVMGIFLALQAPSSSNTI